MAKMSIHSATLGTFIFPHNPSKATVPKVMRLTASKRTLSSIAFYSWGTTIIGKEIDLEWKFMRTGTFATFDLYLKGDEEITWNPEDSSGKLYTCEILDLDGNFHTGLSVAANTYRTNVKMELLIKAQV